MCIPFEDVTSTVDLREITGSACRKHDLEILWGI